MPTLAPVQLVIFGLTGHLARTKLLPALYQLTAAGLLPSATRIVGVTRRSVTTAEVLDFMHGTGYDPAVVKHLASMIHMFKMNLTELDDYHRLKAFLDKTEQIEGQCSHRLLYLSMPPQVFAPVIELLGTSGLNAGCPHGGGHSRFLIEKPFGFDLASAEELVKLLAQQFNEEQIYRIDHYVAKETSQNILVFRHHNPLFQAVWDHQHIKRITVSATETLDIEGRFFYDQIGALRDLLQNHLLQLLALITMELPRQLTADSIHAEKLKLLQAIPAIAPDQVAAQAVRGQYQGYRDEVANADSRTETFAAVHLAIANDRWRDVPIVVQTGKALDQKITEIELSFDKGALTFRIEPGEGITLDLMIKKPGLGTDIQPAAMDFRYAQAFTNRHPDAYERVLADAIRGDRTLFTTSAEALECWRIVDAVVAEWAKSDAGMASYRRGSAAHDLV